MADDDGFKQYSWLTPYVFFALFFLVLFAGYAHFAETDWWRFGGQTGVLEQERLTFPGAGSQDAQSQRPTTQQATGSGAMSNGCPSDLFRCPSGVYVERNPSDECKFYSCPEGEDVTVPGGSAGSRQPICPTGVISCPDGSTLYRDPNNNCLFPSCPPIIGLPCELDSECPGAYVCSAGACAVPDTCNANSDCPQEYACVVNECVEIGDGVCTSDSDCEGGQECISGSCGCGAPMCPVHTVMFLCGDPGPNDKCPEDGACVITDELACTSGFDCGAGTYYGNGLCCPEGYEPDTNKRVCTQKEGPCQEDLYTCPDGTKLARDYALGCEFPECPEIITVCVSDPAPCPEGEYRPITGQDDLGCDMFGSCQSSCDDGLTYCDGQCVDMNSNDLHCGSCGNVCSEDYWCVNGVCGIHVQP